ncbi:MAG: hemolysin family protein [Lachnospiraceae bacterium]|nr:hemolysin family protein [Lachnospiraceae bacterium]
MSDDGDGPCRGLILSLTKTGIPDIEVFGIPLLHILVPVLFFLLLLALFTALGVFLPGKLVKMVKEGVEKLLRGGDVPSAEDDTEQEIIDLVNEGHEQGVIEDSEVEMISNIFAYSDKEAQDIMTHRSNMEAFDGETPFPEAVSRLLSGQNSRYPVYEENLDHITGILYLKDALRYQNTHPQENRPIGRIEGLLRKTQFTLITTNIDDLFKTLQSTKVQMAIVIDEYGQTAGLVTMEDILEEIVGNIQDEYDDEQEFIDSRSEDAWVMEGLTPLEDIEDRLGITFDETEFDTLNGFLIRRLDHIPREGEEFECEYKGYLFRVLSVENMRIQSVLVTKKAEEPLQETERGEEG